MIDWYNLVANSLWISACALALAVLSLARWEALTRGGKLRDRLNTKRWQATLSITGVLFCVGLAAASDVLWVQILWLVMLLLFFVQLFSLLFSTNNRTK
ncbi:MAG: hypothetical protein MUO62_00500 [Anaerolineales bacterium]|nr:hypothetical protein [Anaerolineales bacterium]